jgi:hypothetical protein
MSDFDESLNDGEGDYIETTRTLKAMLWRDESVTTDTLEIVEAPEGTVFEPYFEPYLQNAEVERVESIGANLISFPYDNGTKGAGYTKTINGITWVVNADGSVTANGTATASSNFELCNLEKMSAGTYTISGADTNVILFLGFKNAETGADNGTVTSSNKTATIGEGYCIVQARVSSGKTVNSVTIYPMFVKGSKVIPYKPYQAEPIDTFEIPEEVRNLIKDGIDSTYYNRFEFVDDKVNLINQCPKIVLNGTEKWTYMYPNDPKNYFYISIGEYGSVVAGKCISDEYPSTTISSNNTNVGIYIANSSAGEARLLIRPSDSANLTVANFKKRLEENPVTVIYAKTVAEKTDITHLFTDDNKIKVERGGALRFVNERE